MTKRLTNNRRNKIYLLFVEILFLAALGCLSLLVSNAYPGGWEVRVFASAADRVLEANNKLWKNSISEIGPTDPGFAEISSILSEFLAEDIPRLNNPRIANIEVQTRTGLVISMDPNEQGPRLTLKITLRDGTVLEQYPVYKKGWDLAIEKEYLDTPLHRWSLYIVLLGFVVSVIFGIVSLILDL